MRRVLIPVLLVVTACTGTQGEPTTTATSEAPTSSTGPVATSTTLSTTTIPPISTTSLPPLLSLGYREVAAMGFPVQVVARPGEGTAYVITKRGEVRALVGAEVAPEPVLDISDRVRNEGERGLLSIALHPSDPSRLYLHYSDSVGDTVVSEFTFLSPSSADPASERILFQAEQPAPNHNGGMLQFAPDGSLLLALGDGGGSGDRYNNGQNPDSLLGGLVAIDIEGGSASSYAKGLRNPWRFWIDDNLIYVADVGQNLYEEVSVVGLAPGLNFGWPITEGLHCFQPSSECDLTGLVVPLIEVEHGDAGTCSITGGVVYRGAAIPELQGAYLYSDYCGGWLRSFRYADGAAVDLTDWTDQVGVPGRVTGFGIDGTGEAYVTTDNGLFAIVAVR
ncbi:MAG: PQQ-dependent sugar dehydrogenase [Actinomycetota bacterium]|nr:PQQ-dependent sugar dehydrogenase [Actinomycetota bacterium]